MCDILSGKRRHTICSLVTGVQTCSLPIFANRDSPPDFGQINRAVASAQALAALGPPIEGTPWMGSRPSIIDGLPVIGRALLHENLWFNFGHHHIGLSLSAGSALLLTALLQDSQPPVDPAPFDPGRFAADARRSGPDRKSTRLNSSH